MGQITSATRDALGHPFDPRPQQPHEKGWPEVCRRCGHTMAATQSGRLVHSREPKGAMSPVRTDALGLRPGDVLLSGSDRIVVSAIYGTPNPSREIGQPRNLAHVLGYLQGQRGIEAARHLTFGPSDVLEVLR